MLSGYVQQSENALSAPLITIFYRRPRESGNFSIESSFDAMLECFPQHCGFRLRKFVSGWLSTGVYARLRGIIEARMAASDVNHVNGDTHYIALGLPGKRTILTIHDCAMVDRPASLRRTLLKLFWIDLPVRHCALVTAVSCATRRDILRLTGCNPDKVVVVPTVVPTRYTWQPAAFNDTNPLILHVGTAGNKNLERHVRALAGINCVLRIIGRLSEAQRQLLAQSGITYENECNVDDARMLECYQQCDMLLFASTIEGFGMPIIEAQRVGRAVVTSSVSSMPEIAGDGACLVDPLDVDAIRAGVLRVIKDIDFRRQLLTRGRQNANRFDASSVAEAYATLYQRLLNQQHQTDQCAVTQTR